MPSYVPCKKNDANGYITYISLVSQANGAVFQVNPTLAVGDVKIAIDDGAPANLGTLPVVDVDFTKRVKVVLSQAETNGDNLTIEFSDAAGSEWCDLLINIQTAVRNLDAIPTAAELNAEVDSALADIDLDHLIQVSAGVEEPTDGSYLDQVMHKAAGQTFSATTDSLEALKDTRPSNAEIAAAVWAITSAGGLAGTMKVLVQGLKAVLDKLDNTLEDDAGTYRFTENALEEAPSGTGASAAVIADAVWDELIADHDTEGSTGEALAAATEITLEED